MAQLIAILIGLLVFGAFLLLSDTSLPDQLTVFGSPVFGAGLVGLVIFIALKHFRIIR